MRLVVLVTMFFGGGVEKEFYMFTGGDSIAEAEEYILKSVKQIADSFWAEDYIIYVPADARVIE